MSTKQKIALSVFLTILGQCAVEWLAWLSAEPPRCAGVGISASIALVGTSIISAWLFSSEGPKP
jgi:hypothetical protein